MGKAFNYERAEQEANKIGLEFANSNDVVKDMSRAYNVDFSNIKVHTDSAADNKVKAAGKDALAQGNDIFFGKGIFESSDPADKGLVAHEFAHTMQQGAAMGGEMAVAESAPMGAAQGGLGTWFREHFTSKGRADRRARKEREKIAKIQADHDDEVSEFLMIEDDRKNPDTVKESARLNAIAGMKSEENPLDVSAAYGNYAYDRRNYVDGSNEKDTYYQNEDLRLSFGWNEDLLNTASDYMSIMGENFKNKGESVNLSEHMDEQTSMMAKEAEILEKDQFMHFSEASRLLSYMPRLDGVEDKKQLPPELKDLYTEYKELEEKLKSLGVLKE